MIYLKEFANHNEYTAYTADTANFLKPNASYCDVEDECHFTMAPPHDYSKDFLTFVALEEGTFMFRGTTINYSLDGGHTWATLQSNASTPTILAGQKILWSKQTTSYFMYPFSSTCRFKVQGNIMSIVNGSNFDTATVITNNTQFQALFSGCTKLVSAEHLILPATALTGSCYSFMFSDCTSLVSPPEVLPAPTTANAGSVYKAMFSGCTSLTSAPKILATELVSNSCCYMFQGCTSLTDVPDISASTLGSQSCWYMFKDCTSLTVAPNILATAVDDYCCGYMFAGCTALTNVQESLPVMSLVIRCYFAMFSGCTSLTTAPQLPATTLKASSYESMFAGCTSLTAAPELPATTLVSNCYREMFKGCSNLNYIKAMFTTTPSTSYTSSWVSGVSSNGTFVKNSAAQWNVSGVNGVPNGWTIETASS